MSDVIPLRGWDTGLCRDNADLARWLRTYADSIERGDMPIKTVSLTLEGANGSLSNYCAATGHLDFARACGLLLLAAQWKALHKLDDVLGSEGT